MSQRSRIVRTAASMAKCRTVDVCDIFGDNSGKALYRLDGNANDESGNYHGTETAITYGGGIYERGAVFNGTSSYIATTLPPSLFTLTSSWSVSVWANFRTQDANSNTLINNWNGTTPNYAGFGFGVTSTSVNYGYINSTSGVIGSYATSLAINTWYNLSVVTVNGVSSLYIDGVFKQTYATAGSINPNINMIMGIASRDLTSSPMRGSIDQVRIFNRAITATEVATLYAECAPTSTVDNINPFEDGSLKALYQFNGDATDKTGVYNGTATNVTYGTGKFGQCAVFNGSTSKVVFTGAMPSNGDITVCGYIKVNSLAVHQSIVYIGNPKQIQFNLRTTGIMVVTDGTIDVASSTALVIGVWYFVAYTVKNSVTQIYINAAKSGTSASPSFLTAANSNSVGYEEPFSRYSFNGSIDQIQIFNKGLTPMELACIMNQTTPLEEPMHSLVDPFKDGSGKALYRLDGNALDESGNYNLTATGTFSYVNGKYSRAIANSTDGQYLTYPAVSGWNSTSNGAVTMWIYLTANADNTMGLFDSRTTGGLGLGFSFNDGTNTLKDMALGTSISTNMSINTWYFFAFSLVRSTNTWTITQKDVNGSTLKTTTVVTAHVTGAANNIMGVQNLGTYSFRGYNDQVRFFGRNLTTQEIDTLSTEI